MINIRKKLSYLSQSEIEEIKSFLDANFSTVFHEPDFNMIVEEVFNTEFSYNLLYNKKGRLIALCPLHSIKDRLLRMTYSNPAIYEVPYGGWVYDINEVSLLDLINQVKLSISEALSYTSSPLMGEEDYSHLEKKIRFQTAIIDLSMSESNIWQNSINSKKRNKIKKAQKNNILIEKFDYTGFDDYYQLMKETYQFAGLKTNPREYYIKILKTYFQNNKSIIFLAKKNSNLLSGNILLRNKHICHYWLSARKRGAENLGQGELLQWEAIKWAKKTGSGFYDLCVVEPERLPDIARFKLGFSKHIVPFYHITKRKLSYRIISMIQRCF